jgi:DNA-binding protein H-NS
MKGIDLNSLSVEELWALHEEIALVLSTKIIAEKLKLENRLYELGKLKETSPQQRRPYPKVHPKFRNPEPPHETWSGRGRQPRWLTELIATGKTIDDFRILTRIHRR